MNEKYLKIDSSLDTQGLKVQPWWVEQWMELINSYRFKKRLERAWSYARAGNVTSIRFEGRRVHARVQGTGEDPYKVKLWLEVLSDEDWQYILEAMTEKASWSAQLLAGLMPRDIERAFAASGKRLFPFKLQEVRSECNCPDKANPCKHVSAVYFLMGERFREDPFVLFQLRGRSRNKLLAELAEHRRQALSKKASHQLEQKNFKKNKISVTQVSGIKDPSKWWQYNSNLKSDLVVITPPVDGGTSIADAGDLPIAEDPKFPNAGQNFMMHLTEQGKSFAERAMMQAMKASE